MSENGRSLRKNARVQREREGSLFVPGPGSDIDNGHSGRKCFFSLLCIFFCPGGECSRPRFSVVSFVLAGLAHSCHDQTTSSPTLHRRNHRGGEEEALRWKEGQIRPRASKTAKCCVLIPSSHADWLCTKSPLFSCNIGCHQFVHGRGTCFFTVLHQSFFLRDIPLPQVLGVIIPFLFIIR